MLVPCLEHAGTSLNWWNPCLEHAGTSFWVFAYFFVDKVVVMDYFGFLVVSLLKACRDMLLGQVLRYLP